MHHSEVVHEPHGGGQLGGGLAQLTGGGEEGAAAEGGEQLGEVGGAQREEQVEVVLVLVAAQDRNNTGVVGAPAVVLALLQYLKYFFLISKIYPSTKHMSFFYLLYHLFLNDFPLLHDLDDDLPSSRIVFQSAVFQHDYPAEPALAQHRHRLASSSYSNTSCSSVGGVAPVFAKVKVVRGTPREVGVEESVATLGLHDEVTGVSFFAQQIQD